MDTSGSSRVKLTQACKQFEEVTEVSTPSLFHQVTRKTGILSVPVAARGRGGPRQRAVPGGLTFG